MLENLQGNSWGSILPLCMPSLLPHDLCLGWSSLPAHRCMDLSLGFLFCSIDLYFCLCASTLQFWGLWLCTRASSQAGWLLQFHSSFSRLLWVVYLFSLYWFFRSVNMVYFSIYLCHLWLLSSVFYSFLYIDLLFLWVNLFLSIDFLLNNSLAASYRFWVVFLLFVLGVF